MIGVTGAVAADVVLVDVDIENFPFHREKPLARLSRSVSPVFFGGHADDDIRHQCVTQKRGKFIFFYTVTCLRDKRACKHSILSHCKSSTPRANRVYEKRAALQSDLNRHTL